MAQGKKKKRIKTIFSQFPSLMPTATPVKPETTLTCSVCMEDRATVTLSAVSCVLLRPRFKASISISRSLSWILVRPEGLWNMAWIWLKLSGGPRATAASFADELKRQGDSRLCLCVHADTKTKTSESLKT